VRRGSSDTHQEAQQSKATAAPRKLDMTLRSRRSTRFGKVGVDFEQMTKESYTKKQLKGNDDGSDTETEREEK
jgi:hypothetical protein